MALRINGQLITAIGFAFDGCHKFYLLENDADCKKMVGLDYNIYLIEGLPEAWVGSCPLRFIDSADLKKCYVHQGEPAYFEGWNIPESLQRELDEMAEEQKMVNEEYEHAEY